MKPAFLLDFYNRKRQVRHYLATVRNAERASTHRSPNGAIEARLLTLRAGTFLVLYNLIEATTRGAIEAIHYRITTSGVTFGDLALSLRIEVVRRFKRQASPSKNHTMADFPSAFVAVALQHEIKLSGNVDAKYIREELGECYGFSCLTSPETRGGSDLVKIKQNRNDLAHGIKTFEEVGRDYPFRDLLELSLRSMQYMNEILNNVAFYLDGQVYLAAVFDVPNDDRADRAG